MNMQTPPDRFEAATEIKSQVDKDIDKLELMARSMPQDELEWTDQGYHIYCVGTEIERKVGGPVFSYPKKQWIVRTCPSRFLAFIDEYRRMKAEIQCLNEQIAAQTPIREVSARRVA